MAGVGRIVVHNSPVRGETFVTRKITRAMARIKLGLQDCLYLGNLNAKRDWGHARDFVEAQWRMLQLPKPEDFVIATGEQHSVREFVEAVCKELGMKIRWEGKGVKEVGILDSTLRAHQSPITNHQSLSLGTQHSALSPGSVIVAIDPRYFRPTEVDALLGDASKARKKLGWTPKIKFKQLVAEMAQQDFKLAQRDELVTRHGHKAYVRNE
jgi:GDPmannose 4,6-dehydratase